MTDKEQLAKRWESVDQIRSPELVGDTAEYILNEPYSFDIERALLDNDVTTALAIKDALFPGWDVQIQCIGGVWMFQLMEQEKRDCRLTKTFEGKSIVFAHAIMAALVRASKEAPK